MKYFCCGMIRSGSTWQYNIVRNLLEKRNLAEAFGFIGNEDKLYECIADKRHQIIKMHEAFSEGMEAVKTGAAKAIYCHRDLPDVAASLMERNKKNLQWVIENRYLEKALKNYQKWTTLPGIFIQDYKTIINHPAKGIKEIAAFLNLTLQDGELQSLLTGYSIESQKKSVKQMEGSSNLNKALRKLRRRVGGVLQSTIGKDKTKKIIPLFGRIGVEHIDKKSLLHSEHISTGEIGSYKKVMSKKEQSLIEEYLQGLTIPLSA